jgi:hypothetical protein
VAKPKKKVSPQNTKQKRVARLSPPIKTASSATFSIFILICINNSQGLKGEEEVMRQLIEGLFRPNQGCAKKK